MWKFWAQKKQLRIQLRIGGRLMWDITEEELRAAVLYSGGAVEHSARTQFANQLIELIVTKYP
jgi:hypothetical protein